MIAHARQFVTLCLLQDKLLSKVCTPTLEEYTRPIGRKYPIHRGTDAVWDSADRLKVLLAKSSNWFIQNQFYNGWSGSTFVNSIFIFSPDGRTQMCTINATRTWNDNSMMADCDIYQKIEKVYKG